MRTHRAWGLIGLLLATGCGKPGGEANSAPPSGVPSPAVAASGLAGASPAVRAAAPVRPRPGSLNEPSDLDMVLIWYAYSGQTPPVGKWADADTKVRNTDEFDRAGVRAQTISALNSQLAAVKDVGMVRLRARTYFSEYAAEYGGYYINALSPGMSFMFKAQDQQVNLRIANANDAYRWKLPTAKAKEVLNRNHGVRAIDIIVDIKLANARTEGAAGVIDGTVTHVTVLGSQDAVFGEYGV